MRPSCILLSSLAAVIALSATARATTFTFATDPFAGSTALTTPGRQIVGNELQITFNIATDVFAFDRNVFGIDSIQFANGNAASLPTSGVNVIVLQEFAVPFAAGTAANLIAAQITTPGPGFFIYFNSGLDLARLVYSTDLNDSTADLKILARMLNLNGQAGRDAFPSFTSANFQTVPEAGGNLTLVLAAGALFAVHQTVRRRTAQA